MKKLICFDLDGTFTTDKEFSSTRLNEIIQENPFICLLERCDNE